MDSFMLNEVAHSRMKDLRREAEERRRAGRVRRPTLAERVIASMRPMVRPLRVRRTAAEWVTERARPARRTEPTCCAA